MGDITVNQPILPQVLRVTPCCGSIMRTPGTEGFVRARNLLELGVCPDCEVVLSSDLPYRITKRGQKAKEWFTRHAVRAPDFSWRWSDSMALVALADMPPLEEGGR